MKCPRRKIVSRMRVKTDENDQIKGVTARSLIDKDPACRLALGCHDFHTSLIATMELAEPCDTPKGKPVPQCEGRRNPATHIEQADCQNGNKPYRRIDVSACYRTYIQTPV